MLIGLDGFSTDINDNYFDSQMRHPVTSEQAAGRNKYYKEFINRVREAGIEVEFVTKSKYE